MASLAGYTLVLRCTRCGLIKQIEDFPSAMNLPLGEILTPEHIAIYEKGCIRCGTCRFEVLTAPGVPLIPEPPVGWSPRKEPS